MSPTPVGLLLRVVSRIVPPDLREGWLAEWNAEIEHAYHRALSAGVVGFGVRIRLTIRACESLADALWLRGRHGSGGRFRGVIRDAVRSTVRRPGYALAVVATLGLGIGTTTAIFTVVDSLVLRPIPFQDSHELVSIRGARGSPSTDVEAIDRWASESDVFSDVRRLTVGSRILTGAGEARDHLAWEVEAGFLEMLGIVPALGRRFTLGDSEPGARVVMLSHDIWTDAFGRDPEVVGRRVELDGDPHTVVGVLPPTLRRLPVGTVQLLLPLPAPTDDENLMAIARLRTGLSLDDAQARLDAVAAVLGAEQPRELGWGVRLSSLEETQWSDMDRGLVTLGIAVLCLLLVACANAAGLLLLRGVSRRPELRLRLALGAPRASLVGQLMVESVLLASVAGVLGTALSRWSVQGLVAMLPSSLVRFSYTTVTVDFRVLAFAVATTLVTGLLFGALPAWRAGRVVSLGTGRGGTATREEVRLRSVMQVAQMALAVVLLAGAALFGRSFERIVSVPIGFDPDNVLELRLVSTTRIQGSEESAIAFAHDLDERLRAIPEVAGVARTTGLGFTWNYSVELDTGERRDSVELELPYLSVDTAYFRVMDIGVVEGRGFNAQDVVEGSDAVVVDRDLAEWLFNGEPAVGRRFRIREGRWRTVVGVTEDVKLEGPRDPLGPLLLFYPGSSAELRSGTILVRTAVAPADAELAVRGAVSSLDPGQPIRSLQTGREVVSEAIADSRFVVLIMAVLAVVAVLLTSIGVYGLVSFTVVQRNREIGIRMALGARSGSVVAGVVRWGMVLGAAGIAIGLGLSVVLGRLVEGLLFETGPTDPGALAIAALTILLACAAALVRPSTRAAHVDPSEVLRSE